MKIFFEIQSDFKYLPFLTSLFPALKVKEARALTQILVEGYTNAVIHGHRHNQEKWVGIGLDWNAKRVKIQVVDRGRGIRKQIERSSKTLWKTQGRGLQLMSHLSDRVRHQRERGRHVLEVIRRFH